jgi:hypothetical protein
LASDYNEAIRLDPKYAADYINRGVAYADQRKFDKAISDTTRRSGSIRAMPLLTTIAGLPIDAPVTTKKLMLTLRQLKAGQ